MTTTMAEGADAPRSTYGAKIILAFAALLCTVDVLHDIHAGGNPSLALIELATMALVLATAGYYWRQAARVRGHADRLVRRLDSAEADADRWRREAANVLPALGAAVQRQFDRWGFTEEERRIAMLLLGGSPLPEVARRLGMSVRTLRQRALGVYSKASVAGRAELAAFFLSDLFYLAGVATPRQDEVAAQM